MPVSTQPTRRQLDGGAMATMLLLCMIWGLQQVAIKAVADDMAPLLQIALRSGISAALIALLMTFSSVSSIPRINS
jgi:drug/metabolite transporter (DMT)-like permease